MKQCPNCGAQMPDQAKWCSQCGQKLPEAPVNYNQQQFPHQPQKNNRQLIVAVWVVAALLLVAIVLFFFTRAQQSSNQEEELISDTAVFSDPTKNPWEEIDRQRNENQNRRETIKVVEAQQPATETPAAQWISRTINAKYYDSTGDYPVKITFEENSDGQIRNCMFNNVNYGGKIPLRGRSTSDGYTFSGSAAGQTVSITFENLGGQLQGRATIAGKEVTLTATMY